MHRHLQVEMQWDRALSDQVPPGGAFESGWSDPGSGRGEESTLLGTVRYLRSGWPNIVRVVANLHGHDAGLHATTEEG